MDIVFKNEASLLNEYCALSYILRPILGRKYFIHGFSSLQNTRRQAENPAFSVYSKIVETTVLIDLYFLVTNITLFASLFIVITVYCQQNVMCHGENP